MDVETLFVFRNFCMDSLGLTIEGCVEMGRFLVLLFCLVGVVCRFYWFGCRVSFAVR